jgi:cysteinyl-tRNA synthetase
MVLKIFNTMTKKKEVFKPVKKGKVHIYVCGPTVYDYTHLGHARTYTAFDVIVRWFKFLGFEVLYVQNITDVGHLTEDTARDKVVEAAKREKIEPMELVETYMREYFKDMDLLGVERPNISPRASGHIVEIIEAIKKLIEKGYAYEVNGNVFFDVSKFKDYGKLSKIKPEEMLAGTRFEAHPDKKDPKDFALWKRAKKEDLLRWPSPWGEGFPGWHIECSIMSMRYLGETLDIHGGAVDLIFPHHENEIAQSEALTGKTFVKYWMHTRFLTINGEKMAKSLGNFITVREALKKYDAEVIRMFFLSSHYRTEIDWNEKKLKDAEKSLERLYTTLDNIQDALKNSKSGKLTKKEKEFEEKIKKFRKNFIDAMNDDFNTPQALATMFEFSREVNKFIETEKKVNEKILKESSDTILELGKTLGLFQKERKEKVEKKIVEGLVNILLDLREKFRKEKDFKTSDEIRKRLNELGMLIEDTPSGVKWKIK